MLTANIDILGRIAFLRSDFRLRDLINFQQNIASKPFDKLSLELTIKSITSSLYRKDQLDSILNEHSTGGVFGLLGKCFDEWIRISGNQLQIKDSAIHDYAVFVSRVHPFFVLSYGVFKRYQGQDLDSRAEIFAQNVNPSGFCYEGEILDYAENHMHLNGWENFFYTLNYLIENPPDKSDEFSKVPNIGDFPLLNSGTITFYELVQNLRKSISYCNEKLLGRKNIKWATSIFDYPLTPALFKELSNLPVFQINNPLLTKILSMYGNGDYQKQFFLYFIAIFGLQAKHKDDLVLERNIEILIHCINILRSYMVMTSNVGLSHFVEFFNSKLRKWESLDETEINRQVLLIKNALNGGTTHLELKVSADFLNVDKIQELLNKVEFSGDIEKKLHLSVHFIKRHITEKGQKRVLGTKNIRYIWLRKEIQANSAIIEKFMSCERRLKIGKNTSLDGNMTSSYFDARKLVVSLDAAGQETAAPPEVFAPGINALRNIEAFFTKDSIPVDDIIPHKRLRLSFHAGEDFDFLLTGMRRIDEAVEYLHMAKSDRIWHALAIGMDLYMWAHRNNCVYMKMEDVLDDLVWIQKKSEDISVWSSISWIPIFERIIRDISKQIYETPCGYSGIELYDAWLHRGDDHSISRSIFSTSVQYNNDILNKYLRDSGVQERGEVKILARFDDSIDWMISCSENTREIRYSSAFLKLMEMLQDHLMTSYAKRWVIIEANPSSNSYISWDICSYDEHPIFRWHPPKMDWIQSSEIYNKYGLRNGIIPVCVNTDDPGIFPTTLPNEFRLLKEAAIRKMIDPKSAQEWVEELRIFGLHVFHETTS